MSGTYRVPEADQIQNFLLRLHELLLKPLDLNFLRFVLKYFQLLVVVQQVVELASVNFVHRDGNSEVSLVILKVSNASIEKVSDGQLLEPLHRISLA
jgi:hypothetical protein